jgi:hypothetical protein
MGDGGRPRAALCDETDEESLRAKGEKRKNHVNGKESGS